MIRSMTAYATLTGAAEGVAWVWEMRGVNGRGLDLRLRLPDWVPGLEPAMRKALNAALGRGNVQVSLRIAREEETGESRLDPQAVARALADIAVIEQAAIEAGVALAPSRATDILVLRGMTGDGGDDVGGALAAPLMAEIAPLIAAFDEMRIAEGAALAGIVGAQLDEIAALVDEAEAQVPDRRAAQDAQVREGVARLLAETDLDEARLAQELAQLAIKSDTAEEIDRLRAHVAAARALMTADGPVGRKLDFLTQEFNREANTLCAKAAHAETTRIGLALKVVVDWMREQVQNVE
ncbi:MAG: YicC/YloC family endoribonuclease [Shimia sp.]